MSLHWVWIVVVVVLGSEWLGRWWVRRAWRRKQQALLARAPAARSELVSEGEGHEPAQPLQDPDDLPAPVARYLRMAQPEGREVRVLRMKQEGRLRKDPSSTRWMDFTAEQVVVPGAPGFVWNARVALGHGVHLRVLDSYVDGLGGGQVSLLSQLPLGREQRGPELTEGALHRYLAEGPWYPSALRPGAALRWNAIDDSRALATLEDRQTTVSLEFWFGDSGLVEGIYTPGRQARRGQGFEKLAWEGHFQDYEERQGLLIPMAAEVGWYLDGQWKRVWEGRITAVEFRFAEDG